MADKRFKPTPVSVPDSVVRGRIVGVARRQFLAHGFRRVTLDELAAELGMSKKTFYVHFENKAALVEAVMLDKVGSVEADLERITGDGDADFTEALCELLACMQRHTGEIQPVFFRDLQRHTPEVFALLEARRGLMLDRCFTRLLNAGRRAGMIRLDVSSKLVIEILLAATQAIINPQKLDELKLTPKAGYSALLDVILGGVMTAKGKTKLCPAN